ncbi:GNAT family N-acetyltransferase [Sphaerisporangium album]|uniref:GNAT family N-acetyltransferase n=1 Tax=Sphaerisporangium album TaxID=509200 RepID=A0A367ET31_9ACTN|nr:GNAT family N-acetyltransferase [Sphaerisporangium album]RCG21153.1 GNAT family N-acetyltransferase [Sphaerisporangium album]
MHDSAPAIRLEAWTQADLNLLRGANTPEMTAHLGGPETEARLLDRHHRYLQLKEPGAGQMLAVVLPDGRRAGIIGYWERPWQHGLVYESGWHVLPDFQRRGIATAAARAIAALARAQHRHVHLHAFPAADHPASNAVCREAGFTLLGEADIEYPPGNIMRCNDWRLGL